LTLSFLLYLEKSTSYEAPHYVVLPKYYLPDKLDEYI
jgi:hypothetical protein